MPFSSSYALVLANFYDGASDQTGYYLLAFAAGNPGPLIIGPCSTRGPAQDDHPHLSMSAVLVAISAALFDRERSPR